MSLGAGNLLLASAGDAGYGLARSLRTRASASASLSRTPASAGNRQKFTLSFWTKRGAFISSDFAMLFYSYASTSDYFGISFDSLARFNIADGLSGLSLTTTPVYRDPSSWYHFVIAIDTTQATASNRVRLYVNNVEVTAWAIQSYPAQNANLNYNSANIHRIAASDFPSFPRYYDGYFTEINFVNAQQLTPSSFGSTNTLTGVWQPAQYTGTYGTNGFYLPFTDNSSLTTASNVGLGKDFSGNANYWVTNNISITAGVTYDSMTDVPTLTSATAANFAVLNPIGNGSGTLSNANLTDTTSTTLPDVGTFAMQSGKWYWETVFTSGTNPRIGVYDIGSALPTAGGLGGTAYGWCIINSPSRTFTNNVATAYGAFNGNAGDVVMIAYDPATGNLWFGANGTWFASGNPATNTSPSMTGVTGKAIVPAVAAGAASAHVYNANFGQRPFSYPPPTGFVALNTFNLPTSTIVKGSDNMNIALAAGASIKSTTEALFSGQFLEWIKDRANANNHQLLNGVTGLSAVLQSNTTAAETTYTAPSGNSVGYAWKAGSSSSSNTSGTITSTVSVNASAGFSIATFTTPSGYSNGTVGHGQGVAPALVIVKNRSAGASINWNTYHQSLGNGSALYLSGTQAAQVNAAFWNNTSPTSSVFSIGSNLYPSADHVAYAWTPIAGFSAFGSISANSSADNGFAYTGFLSRFIMLKRTDAASNWIIWDTARNTFNVLGNDLYPNLSNAEASTVSLDILSNGFKLRSSGFAGTWIYAAFATTPFKNSLGF